MTLATRQAALCLIRREDSVLLAEIKNPHGEGVLHRPPGGGIELGETPEQAVRREIQEELGIILTAIEPLGSVDHLWFSKGREVNERVWLFVASAADDVRLNRGEAPYLTEADGEIIKTIWRPIHAVPESFPPLCPAALADILESLP